METKYRLQMNDENWYQIWKEDGEGRELPYCEIVNTDKETVAEVFRAVNTFDQVRVREYAEESQGYLVKIEHLADQLAALQATLAEREARIAELEQAAQRNVILGAAVSDEAGWETAKRFEALYDTARQDAARLRGILQAILNADERGQGLPFQEAMQEAQQALKGGR